MLNSLSTSALHAPSSRGGRRYKALTIWQPYAERICRGEKPVENRTRPIRYRGPLIIHSGKSREGFDNDDELIDEFGALPPFGSIVAKCDLVACVLARAIRSGSLEQQYPGLKDHPTVSGPYCLILENIVRLEPVPYRGQQGLFEIDECFVRPLA